jgi:hypothetical protein
MMRDDDPTEGQTPSPRTTIVGGRPPEDGASLPPVPTGIQRLLRLASVDEKFRAQLVERRAEVAGAAEVELTPSEAAVLAAIPAAQLEQMAAKMPPPAPPRREFLRQTAATAVVLLGGAALGEAVTGCKKKPKDTDPDSPERPDSRELETVGGAAPDVPPDRPDHRMQAPGGAAPDEPPDRPDHREMDTEGGAAPDEPPDRPDKQEMHTRGGSAPDEPPERPDHRMQAPGGANPDLPE